MFSLLLGLLSVMFFAFAEQPAPGGWLSAPESQTFKDWKTKEHAFVKDIIPHLVAGSGLQGLGLPTSIALAISTSAPPGLKTLIAQARESLKAAKNPKDHSNPFEQAQAALEALKKPTSGKLSYMYEGVARYLLAALVASEFEVPGSNPRTVHFAQRFKVEGAVEIDAVLSRNLQLFDLYTTTSNPPAATLDSSDTESIKAYTRENGAGCYKEINGVARKGTYSTNKTTILGASLTQSEADDTRKLAKALAHVPSTPSMVFRVSGFDPSFNLTTKADEPVRKEQANEGFFFLDIGENHKGLIDMGFLSTSWQNYISSEDGWQTVSTFCKEYYKTDISKCTFFVMRSTTGKNIEDTSAFKHEKELLFSPGTFFNQIDEFTCGNWEKLQEYSLRKTPCPEKQSALKIRVLDEVEEVRAGGLQTTLTAADKLHQAALKFVDFLFAP